MPVDPRHGRRIPSGRRFARALSRIFRATFDELRPLIEQGYLPDSGRMRETITRLAMQALGVELVAGYVRTMKEAGRGRVVRNRVRPVRVGIDKLVSTSAATKAKALRFDQFAEFPPSGVAGAAVSQSPAPKLLIDFTLFRPEVRVEAERLALRVAGTIVEDTRRMIREQLSDGLASGEALPKIAERIREVGFSPRRAATIAQTESSRAMHSGEGVAARELGVTRWTWLASSDACELCLSLDGTTVDIGANFYVHSGGNAAYRDVKHPPAHPHCMCSTFQEMPDE